MNWKITWPLLPLSEPQWIFHTKSAGTDLLHWDIFFLKWQPRPELRLACRQLARRRIDSSSTLSRSNATIQIIVTCWHHHIHRSHLVSWDQHRQNRKWQDTMWRFAGALIAYAWNWNKFKLLYFYCTSENISTIEHVNLFTSKTVKHYQTLHETLCTAESETQTVYCWKYSMTIVLRNIIFAFRPRFFETRALIEPPIGSTTVISAK